jgi:hypothetical protein
MGKLCRNVRYLAGLSLYHRVGVSSVGLRLIALYLLVVCIYSLKKNYLRLLQGTGRCVGRAGRFSHLRSRPSCSNQTVHVALEVGEPHEARPFVL